MPIPNLTLATVRRTLLVGWRYLVIGGFLSIFLTLTLVLAARQRTAFETTFPLEIPLFAVLGSTGGLMTFTSDRTKGVFEYLIAYGVRPRSLLTDGLVATAVMSGIILALALTVGIAIASIRGVALDDTLWKALALYTIPMSFAGALFTGALGMIFTSISTPRTGMNSPVGIAPMFGVAPTVLVLIVAESVPSSEYYYVTAGAAAAIVLATVTLLALSGQLMGRERFLSPI